MRTPPQRVYLPEHLELRPAEPADDAFLYELLIERYRNPAANVDGMAAPELPSFEQHVAHLARRPYRRLDIVQVDGTRAGMMYLSHAGVFGCFVLQRFVARGLGLAACHRFLSEVPRPVVVHLNPLNRASRRSAERLGFVLERSSPGRLTFTLRDAPLDPFVELRRSRERISSRP